jgi:hypothetical protein
MFTIEYRSELIGISFDILSEFRDKNTVKDYTIRSSD